MQIQKPKQGYKLVKSLFGKYEEIPTDWEELRYQDVCEFVNGYAYAATEFRESGYLIIRIQNLTGGKNFVYSDVELPEKQFAKKGDLLFAWSATFGPFIWNGPKAAYHYHQWKVIPNEISNKKFLYYHLEKISPIVKQMGQSGLGMFHMTKGGMERFPIYLPKIQEQQKIVSILSNVDNLIDSYGKAIESTSRLKTDLMQQLLTKGIGHKKFKKIFLKHHFLKFSIPNTWEIKNVKQLSTLKKGAVVTGPFGLMLHSSDYVSEGTPLILIKNLQNGKIDDDDIPKISDKDVQRLSRYKVKEGDMIFSRVGRVGSSVLIEEEHNGWLFSGQTLRIRFENPELNSKYVNYYFHSNLFNRVLIPELLGATRDSINTKILEEFPVIVPPKKEQDQIVAILSQADSREYELGKMKSAYKNLKKGLMQNLLTGKIRVRI